MIKAHDWISDTVVTVIKYFQVSKITQFSRFPTKFIKLESRVSEKGENSLKYIFKAIF